MAAEGLGLARAEEQRLEDERCAVKRAAILRIMQSENPLTGKQHSASSAEAVVETDGEYAEYRKRQRIAVVDTECARAAFYAARYRAELAIAQVRETAGAL